MCPSTGSSFSEYYHLASYAIGFALDRLEPFEIPEFLKDYRQGDWDKSWPEFTDYLAEMKERGTPALV